MPRYAIRIQSYIEGEVLYLRRAEKSLSHDQVALDIES